MATIDTTKSTLIDSSGNKSTVTKDPRTGKPLRPGTTIELPATTPPAVAPTPTINSGTIAGSTPVVLPPKGTPTAAAGLGGAVEGATTTVKTESQKAQELAKTNLDNDSSEVLKLIGELGNSGQIKEDLYKDQGVDTARKEADRYTGEIEAEALASRREIERLEKDNPEGLSGGALTDRLGDIERKSTSKQADLAILQSAAQRRYSTASAIADRQLEAKLEPMRAQLEARKFLYENNKYLFDKADEKVLKEEEREYQKTAKELEKIKDMKLEAAKQGASVATLNALSNATTLDEALAVPGANRYLTTEAERLDRTLKSLQIQKARADLGTGGTVVTPPIINPKTGKIDPSGQLSTIISKSGAKDNQPLQAINGVVSAAQAFANSNIGKDNFAGTGLIRPGKLTIGPEGVSNQTAVEAINLKVQQWASGASLTKEQTDSVNRIVPRLNDTPAVIRSKTNALTNFMLNQAKGTLASQGITYEPTEIDLFAPVDTKAIADTVVDDVTAAMNSPETIYSTYSK